MNEHTEILLIEDSPSQVVLFRGILERANYQVRIANDGATGWYMACLRPPKLILLDVELPTLDGFQVLDLLKHNQLTSKIPVIMLTRYEHISDVERALNLGADDYLPKNDAMLQLCSAVEQLIGSSPALAS